MRTGDAALAVIALWARGSFRLVSETLHLTYVRRAHSCSLRLNVARRETVFGWKPYGVMEDPTAVRVAREEGRDGKPSTLQVSVKVSIIHGGPCGTSCTGQGRGSGGTNPLRAERARVLSNGSGISDEQREASAEA